WCTSGYTGTLTVDLGQVRSLADLGLTLDAVSPSASATIELASTAGAWQQVPALHDIALDPGNPLYFPLPSGSRARYAELTVYSDLASDLALARQVHAAGMKIYLDIMYSDFWADPQHQDIPAAWAGQDLGQLTATVRSYTQQVITAFAKQGTPVDLTSIGNEI